MQLHGARYEIEQNDCFLCSQVRSTSELTRKERSSLRKRLKEFLGTNLVHVTDFVEVEVDLTSRSFCVPVNNSIA